MPVLQNKKYICGALLILVCGLPAHAGNEDAIARCARIATVGDRILCLEDALRQSSNAAAERDPAADVSPASAKQTETAPPSESKDRESFREADVSPASTKQSETAPPSEAEVPSPAAQATSITTDDTPVTKENYGLKEQRPPKEIDTIQVTVTSVRKNLTNRFIFETEDAQVWLQTDQRTARYGDTPFNAEIRPASMGSFFLKPASGGVSIRVRREK